MLIFIILVFYKNNKVEEVVSKEKSKVVEDKEAGEYIIYDENNINCKKILNNYVSIDEDVIRHNVIKLSLDIYSYLIDEGISKY